MFKVSKNEKGYALAYVLLLGMLVSMIVLALFAKTLNTTRNVETVAKRHSSTDIGELVSQDIKLRLGTMIYDKTNPENPEVKILGKNDTNLKKMMAEVVTDWSTAHPTPIEVAGVNPKATYQVSFGTLISKKTKAKVHVNWLTEEEANKRGIYAYETTFPITVSIKQTDYPDRTFTFDYLYRIQWTTRDAGEIANRADIWADLGKDRRTRQDENTRFPSQYTYFLTLIRLPQEQKLNSLYGDLDLANRLNNNESFANQLYGNYGAFLGDYGDRNGFIDLSKNHLVGPQNVFKGSLIFDRGVHLKGDDKNALGAKIEAANQIVFGSIDKDAPNLNYIKNVSLQAGTSINIQLNPIEDETNAAKELEDVNRDGLTFQMKQNKKFVIDNDAEHYSIDTPNVLLHTSNYNGSTTDQSTVVLGEGVINVGAVEPIVDLSKYRYPIDDDRIVPDKRQWDNMHTNEGSSFTISNTVLKLTSDDYYIDGKKIKKGEKDTRKINVNGNFTLTNYGIGIQPVYGPKKRLLRMGYVRGGAIDKDDRVGEEASNAFRRSILEMSGPNTSLTVNGFSALDCPKDGYPGLSKDKMFYRMPHLDKDAKEAPFSAYFSPTSRPNNKYYDGYSMIHLQNGASIRLGYTSVQPFILKMSGDNTLFRMKVLPNAIYFEPYFLEEWVKSGKHGKVILDCDGAREVTAVKKKLDAKNIPNTTVTAPAGGFDESKAIKGKVTIVKSGASSGDSIQYIDRVRSKLENLTY